MEQFSRGCVAGGRMFAVIRRTPAIDPDDESGQELEQVRVHEYVQLMFTCSVPFEDLLPFPVSPLYLF